MANTENNIFDRVMYHFSKVFLIVSSQKLNHIHLIIYNPLFQKIEMRKKFLHFFLKLAFMQIWKV